MLRGIYTSASGMLTQQRVQEMKSNNIANTNTSGYKRDMSVKRSFPNMLISRINDGETLGPMGPEVDFQPVIGQLGTGVLFEETVKDFSQGPLIETGNTLDLALEGDGFFNVLGPGDEVHYTRQGALTLLGDGTLVNQQGYPILGTEGVIQLTGEEEITVDTSGAVYEGDEFIDLLAFSTFDNPQGLTRAGENLLGETDESGPPIDVMADEEDMEGLSVRQGFVESSNVSAVKEMTGMINALRAYESNQRSIQGHDETLERAVNQIGSPPS